MTTPRRSFLRLCSIVGVGALAGCAADSNPGNPNPTTTEQSENGTSLSTGTSERNSTSKSTETSGMWTQQAMFTADDVAGGDGIGSSVAVSGDGTTAIVGAPLTNVPPQGETTPTGTGTPTVNPEGRNAGAAYVFKASDGSWSQQTKLTVDDSGSGDRFGVSVAVSNDGTAAIIGAERFDDQEDVESGLAYVFDASGGSWSQQAKLTVDDPVVGDNFGRAVAMSGDGTTVIVGAHQDGQTNSEEPGVVYVFTVSDGSWDQQAELIADDGDAGDRFGRAVAVSDDGTTTLVGADLDENPNGELAGSAYVFKATDGSWSQQTKLAADDGDTEDAFGWSVGVSGDGTTAIIGAQTDEDPNGEKAGSAYIFESSDSSWSQQAKLAASDGASGSLFGGSVAISGDGTTALVGAEKADRTKGSAYVFETSSGVWDQKTKLTPDDRAKSAGFGGSVSVSGDGSTALVGDPAYLNNPYGAAYVFIQ